METNPFIIDNHEVPYISKLHVNLNKNVKLLVREYDGTPLHGRRKCVLMIHGRSSPALTTFDLGYDNGKYSWAQFLAKKGFDVFIFVFQGSGRSPLTVMNDPCNTSKDQQVHGILIPNPLEEECADPSPIYPYVLTTSESEWDELDTVVKFILERNSNVNKVALISVSAGAWAVGPYAMQNPDKVESVLLNAPIFPPNGRTAPPPTLPQAGIPLLLQMKAPFMNSWGLELGRECDQVEPGIMEKVWNSFMENDPIGHKWGGKDSANPEGILRFRNATRWGWTTSTVSNGILGDRVPVCIIYGENDNSVNQTTTSPFTTFSVNALYDAIPGEKKLMFKIACTGHQMIWETKAPVLHDYSYEWLDKGKVEGKKRGKFYRNRDNQIEIIKEDEVFYI